MKTATADVRSHGVQKKQKNPISFGAEPTGWKKNGSPSEGIWTGNTAISKGTKSLYADGHAKNGLEG